MRETDEYMFIMHDQTDKDLAVSIGHVTWSKSGKFTVTCEALRAVDGKTKAQFLADCAASGNEVISRTANGITQVLVIPKGVRIFVNLDKLGSAILAEGQAYTPKDEPKQDIP